MTEVDDNVIAEITDRGQNVRFKELIGLIERAHPDAPGVTQETLNAYAHELGDAPSVPFTPEELLSTVDDWLTDSDTWVGQKALYSLDGRISVYPARWHDTLGGDIDIPAYIQFIEDDVVSNETDITRADPGDGIDEEDLLDLVATVGRTDKGAVKSRLEQLRDRGVIAEGADQHPDARVYLRERTDRRDPALEE